MNTASMKLAGVSRKSLYEAFFTIGGRLASVLLVVATTKFLTTFLSEAEYGRLALYNITATLPATFFFGPVGQGILRFYPIAKEKNEFGSFHRSYHRLYVSGSRVVLAAGVAGSLICWFLGNVNWAVACLLIAVSGIVASANTYRYGLQNAARNRTLALGLETGERVLQQLLAIALLWYVTGDPLVVLAGYLVASAVFFFANRHYYQKSFPQTTEAPVVETREGKYVGEILRYSWPFILFGVFFWIQNASERWTLELLCDTEMVGRYAVLNQIGFQSLNLLFGSISYFLFPILFNRAGSLQNSGQFERADQLNRWYLWFNVGLTLALFGLFQAFGAEVIGLLSDDKYAGIAWMLPYMVVAGGLFNFAQNYANRYMLALKTSKLVAPKVAASLAGIALNFMGAAWFGLPGLVFSVVITQALYVALIVLVWKKTERPG